MKTGESGFLHLFAHLC